MSLALGVWDVDGLLREMPASLLAEWMAFDRVEPVSVGFRGDVASGIVASTIANVYRDTKRRREPFEASEFMAKYGSRLPVDGGQPSPEEVMAKVKMWAERYR